MKKEGPHFLDELDHEINGIRVLFNVWHEKTPPAVRGRLHQHLSCMIRVVKQMRRSKSMSLKGLESLIAQTENF